MYYMYVYYLTFLLLHEVCGVVMKVDEYIEKASRKW